MVCLTGDDTDLIGEQSEASDRMLERCAQGDPGTETLQLEVLEANGLFVTGIWKL
jgi:hypothetical protein